MGVSIELPGDFLDQPVERASRIVAIDLMRKVDAARLRLIDPTDLEALHDFRVALRRLRSWTRAFRPHLSGSVDKKDLRRLKRVANATSTARDTEVQLEWLIAREEQLEPAERVGAAHLRRRLEMRKANADATLHSEIGRDLARATESLNASLPVYSIRARVDEPPRIHSMALAIAELVKGGAQSLRDHLRHVRSVDDQTLAHGARIEGKRLRYLLEPIADGVEGADDVIAGLKALQNVIGELHDAFVLSREVMTEAETSSPTDVGRPGIVALARALREREVNAFAELASLWLEGSDHARAFFDSVARLSAHLAAHRPRDTEIERKYLLHALPDRAHSCASEDIEQGYLPGAHLAERLRRVRQNGDTHCYRTVKVGFGIARTEIEEEAPAALFDAMWPLTEGHRVHKRRYAIPDESFVWEIDEFTDRDLVLAEVELPDPTISVAPPDWLAPYIVREVTGEPEYLNINLAG
jgi:CHAD domain-containing protein/CYTH domain-containing protein